MKNPSGTSEREALAGERLAEAPPAFPRPAPPRFPLLALLRPRQWVKNAFVLAPLLFAGLATDPAAGLRALAALALFSVAASAGYVVNDLADLERDRNHPLKRWTRALAAGWVSRRQALALLGGLHAVLAAALLLWPPVTAGVLLYLLLSVTYSLHLKRVPVVDLFCLSFGFVLRVWVGALAVGVPLSTWMLITTLCLALYLAAIKRRQELLSSGDQGRLVLRDYTAGLLDRYAQIAAVAALLFYGMYVVEVRPELVLSIPFVLFGLFRYAYLVEIRGQGESPTDTLLRDPLLLVTVLAWVALCGVTLL